MSSVNKFECSQCHKTLSRKQSLQDHERTHSGQKPYACTFCDKAYTRRRGLIRHIRVHTGEKPFVCVETSCTRRFYTKSELQVHRKRNHSDPTLDTSTRKYNCDVCHRQFSNTGNLRRHTKTKHDPNPPRYSCDECGKLYTSLDHLAAHQLIHLGVKPDKCPFCVSAFKTPGELREHVRRRHTGEKPFACTTPGCDAKFCTRVELTSHTKYIHLNEKAHSCPHCPMQFTSKSNLTVHSRVHTGERRHACDACGKRFSGSSNLKRHLRSHLGEKPYACSKCEKRYKENSSLNWHMLSIHPVAGADAAKRQCGVCQKLVSVNSFKRHEKIHTRGNNQQGDQATCEKPRTSAMQFTHGGERPNATHLATNVDIKPRLPVVRLRRLEVQFPSGY